MIDINCISKEFEKININIHKFNYVNVILIIIAAIIGSIGLLTNNYQSVIASKIIGLALIPFISFCIIIITLDVNKILKSCANCFGFILICLFIGMLIGAINAYYDYVTEPTPEMLSRAEFKYNTIYLELFVSFCAGVGVYYAILKTSVVALIGLILVISIIPAICNAGLFYGMALCNYSFHYSFQGDNILEQEKNKIVTENIAKYLDYGNHSMTLFITDISGVFIGFLIMFLVNCM
jgi:hypothetical protein